MRRGFLFGLVAMFVGLTASVKADFFADYMLMMQVLSKQGVAKQSLADKVIGLKSDVDYAGLVQFQLSNALADINSAPASAAKTAAFQAYNQAFGAYGQFNSDVNDEKQAYLGYSGAFNSAADDIAAGNWARAQSSQVGYDSYESSWFIRCNRAILSSTVLQGKMTSLEAAMNQL